MVRMTQRSRRRAAALALAARGRRRARRCSRVVVSPLPPPPYRDEIAAPYDATWRALMRALARENVPLRVVAKDSGVISSDDIISPIGVYADCGTHRRRRAGGRGPRVVHPLRAAGARRRDPDPDQLQDAHATPIAGAARASSRRIRRVTTCVSTGRWEANLLDSVRAWSRSSATVAAPAPRADQARAATRAPSAIAWCRSWPREWSPALRGQGFSPRDLDELWAGLTEDAVRRLLHSRRGRREPARPSGARPTR